MAVTLSPIGNDAPFVDSNGDPLSGGKLYTYTAGSSTAQTTYTTSAGNVANANPVVLGSTGYPTSGGNVVAIWLTAGVSYKFVLENAAGTVLWTRDNISGINDTTVTIDQWVSGPAPTYISATSFSLSGDQTSTFTVGRRLKTTNSGGTIYSTITASAYGALTTITVVNDSGTLDSGLSAVSYGLLSATNQSIPPLGMVIPLTSVSGTNTITASALTIAAALQTGQVFSFVPANTNTGATTLNVNSIAAKNIYAGNSALVGGELKSGKPVVVMYDGTQFQLIGGTYKQPTRTVLTSGTSATYTTPTGATRIDVQCQGPGGGGGAQSANNGNNGSTATVFSTLSAGVGGGGNNGGNGGGAGGTSSGGDINLSGGVGHSAAANGAAATGGGAGGNGFFGGGGAPTINTTGGSAAANTGAGGAGAGAASSTAVGAGGGAGGYCRKLIVGPSATYTYTVGTGGNGGAAGGVAGGNGAAGIIIVDEYYD